MFMWRVHCKLRRPYCCEVLLVCVCAYLHWQQPLLQHADGSGIGVGTAMAALDRQLCKGKVTVKINQ